MNSHATTKAVFVVSLLAGLSSLASAQGTWRVSVDSSGVQADKNSAECSISGDGRIVAFSSDATNLVANDSNNWWDIFVHDRQDRTTTRISTSFSGGDSNGLNIRPSISADGRYVAFEGWASNLVQGDSNGMGDVFVHDRQTGSTILASLSSSGTQSVMDSRYPSISPDGQVVAFYNVAGDLVPGDTNRAEDVFVRDLINGTTTRVSVDSAGAQANGPSRLPSLSTDGQFVEFESWATNLVPGDTNAVGDVFVHDRSSGVTVRVSVDSNGTEGNANSYDANISADGRFVFFRSAASNLVPGDTNGVDDVFMRDLVQQTTSRVSVDSAGNQADGTSQQPKVSANGRYVMFVSAATNLVPADSNGVNDMFLRDTLRGGTTRISVSSSGAQADDKVGAAYWGGLSADGRVGAFISFATNMVHGDTNDMRDVFVHGPHLTLEASPEVAPPGTNLFLTTWGGMATGPAMLYVVDVNGSPIIIKVAPGGFDANGLWTLSGVVPPGLSGNVVTFLAFGLAPDGRVGLTNLEAVAFQ